METVASGLVTPISLAFLGEDDLLVLEKNTGKVQRVVDGEVQSTVLDLAVNVGSERGLLGIALHPDFPTNPGVYLYWTESSTDEDTAVLSETRCWATELTGSSGTDPELSLDQNLITIRAIQQDADQPARGNHDGGVIAFGPDGSSTSWSATWVGVASCRTWSMALRAWSARRPVRWSTTRRCPSHRGDPAIGRRRRHAVGQPVLRRGRGYRRRGRREHPEDLRLRSAEQLWDGVRSDLG